jgi:acetyl-CoA synthetase
MPMIGLFTGYWRSEKATREVFKHGYYYTLDKAYRDRDGYFWYVGRADDVFKASGYRIGPFEIESVLLEHPAVVESAVIGVPDEDGVRGLVVKAYVVLSAAFADLPNKEELKRQLQLHVKSRTAPYKCPKIIEFVTDLPKTVSGKIRRAELRAIELQKLRTHAAHSSFAPRL